MIIQQCDADSVIVLNTESQTRSEVLPLLHNILDKKIEISSSTFIIQYSPPKMEVLQDNKSIDIFQRIPIKILYSDPYKNTLGESNWVVIILVLMLCGTIISGMILGTIHVETLLQILFFYSFIK